MPQIIDIWCIYAVNSRKNCGKITHFCGVKLLAWKPGCVKFWTNIMCNHTFISISPPTHIPAGLHSTQLYIYLYLDISTYTHQLACTTIHISSSWYLHLYKPQWTLSCRVLFPKSLPLQPLSPVSAVLIIISILKNRIFFSKFYIWLCNWIVYVLQVKVHVVTAKYRHHIWPNSAHYLRSGYFNFDDHPGDHIDVHQQIWIELVWKGQSICSAIIEYGVHTTDTREQELGMEALLIVVVAFNLEALLIVVVSSKDLIQFSLKMSFSNYV